MPKTAIVVLSDPAGGDEALGRLFNALASAYDFMQRGAEVEIVFHGAATRWPEALRSPDHPAHALYDAVAPRVAGASHACAAVFGAEAAVADAGVALLAENPVPSTPGLASLAKYVVAGDTVLTF